MKIVCYTEGAKMTIMTYMYSSEIVFQGPDPSFFAWTWQKRLPETWKQRLTFGLINERKSSQTIDDKVFITFYVTVYRTEVKQRLMACFFSRAPSAQI
jgi:hypothetical protein